MGPTQKKKNAKKQTQIVGSFKQLTEVDLFLSQNCFLLMIQSDDSVYGSSPPQDCIGKLFQYSVVEVFEKPPLIIFVSR